MKTLPQHKETAALDAMDEDQLAWLALSLTPVLGPKRILDATKVLASPCEVFRISLTELESLRFPAQAAQFIFEGKARRAAEEEASKLVEHEATILTLGDPAYPARLKEI